MKRRTQSGKRTGGGPPHHDDRPGVQHRDRCVDARRRARCDCVQEPAELLRNGSGRPRGGAARQYGVHISSAPATPPIRTLSRLLQSARDCRQRRFARRFDPAIGRPRQLRLHERFLQGRRRDQQRTGSGPTSLENGSFQVFLTNDPTDGVTNTTDTNESITLTSFGSGPNTIGFSVVQAVYASAGNVQTPLFPDCLPCRDRT